MEGENLPVNQGCDGKVVKHLGEALPHPRVPKFPLALVVEAVGLGRLTALMVPSQQSQPGWVSHLQAEQEQDGLDTKIAPVHIVAHEQEVCVGRLSCRTYIWQGSLNLSQCCL